MSLDPPHAPTSRRNAWLSAALLCAAMLLLPGIAWLLAPRVGGFAAPLPVHTAAAAAQAPIEASPRPVQAAPRPAAPRATTPPPGDGGAVRGKVLDPDGKPVAGAFVGCDDRDKELATSTDREGRFVLPPQASGCKVVSHHPEFTPAEPMEVIAGRENVIHLRGMGAIEGVVVDEKGSPIGSFLLAVESFMGTGEAAETGPPGGQATTFSDPKGAFLMGNLVPGKYVLTASAEGRPPTRSGSIEVEAGRTTHNVKIVLGKGAILSGKVIDAETRRPIAGAVIALDAMTQTQANSIHPGKSDEAGAYTLDGAPPGPFSIRVAHERYRTKIVPGLLTRGAPTLTQDVELQPRGDGGAGDSELGGIGAILIPQPKGVVISFMVGGGPAETSGLRTGDQLTRIDGLDVTGLTVSDCVQRLRGPEGSRVSVTVNREGAGQVEITITRKNVVRN